MALRHFFHSWLRHRAQEKLREKAAEAFRAGRQAEGAGREGFACQVAVVFALGIEAGGLRDRLSEEFSLRGRHFVARFGRLGPRRLVVVESGPGPGAAAEASRAIIAAHQPQWIVAAGFAGALSAELRRFDVVMANSVMDSSGNRLAIDVKVDPGAEDSSAGFWVGRLLSVDHVVRRPEAKRHLARQYGALAVDMESYAVAQVCHTHRVRYLAIRVITDLADEELPADVQRLLNQASGAARLGAAVGALWRRPGSAKDMLRLREHAIVASDRLAGFLASALNQLGPPAQ